ncbi:MAG: serine/threonine protein kinase [Candidatus Hydrogenedentes bacterium]|nr:serine/threonine protein kinase [Candidatus Hydrogenedentota bacterium]
MVATPAGQASLMGKVLGPYQIETLIGRGAMGSVYLAKDTDLGRKVALKVLLGSLARNPDQIARFQQEARSAAPLQHPNIVAIYDTGIRQGVPFIAMEYVEGEPLDRFLRRNGCIDWRNALHIARQVAKALDCAHQAGIVHRDVKPANILIDKNGHVRLTDFGIAKAYENQTGHTDHGQLLGTPKYMSPEQCQEGAKISPASDLYSLGVTLFEMISGKLPFEASSNVALIKRITNDEAPRLNKVMRGIPDDVARVTAHLMERNASARPESASVVVLAFSRLLQENGGKSALPEALDAFIREMAEPRPLGNAATPLPAKRRTHHGQKHQRAYHYAPISGMARTAAAILIVCAAAGGAYWQHLKPLGPQPAAPVLEPVEFSSLEGGAIQVPLPHEQWRVNSIHWIGARNAVVVSVAGRDGGMLHGTQGLLAIDLDTRRVISLQAPAGPMIMADYAQYQPMSASLGLLPPLPAKTPLYESIVCPVFDRGGRREGGSIRLVPQAWNEAVPRAQVLLECGIDAWDPKLLNPWAKLGPGAAAIHPEGNALLALLREDGSNSSLLQEFGVGGWRATVRNTWRFPGESIAPQSVQYTPDGTHALFMKILRNGDTELCAVNTQSGAEAPRPVHSGPLDPAYAVHPSGDHVAVMNRKQRQATIQFAGLESTMIAGGAVEGDFGPEAWHPSGDYLVARMVDTETGLDQLYSVGMGGTEAPERLTHFETGVLWHASVSRDGAWAATAVETRSGAAVVFSPLQAVGPRS